MSASRSEAISAIDACVARQRPEGGARILHRRASRVAHRLEQRTLIHERCTARERMPGCPVVGQCRVHLGGARPGAGSVPAARQSGRQCLSAALHLLRRIPASPGMQSDAQPAPGQSAASPRSSAGQNRETPPRRRPGWARISVPTPSVRGAPRLATSIAPARGAVCSNPTFFRCSPISSSGLIPSPSRRIELEEKPLVEDDVAVALFSLGKFGRQAA